MPSRLSSLLVRDGLVGVKRMEKAFQRQVIYGGCLDTILLEMSLLPEERLTQYLALASGLPPAGRDEGSAIDPRVAALIPRELAEQYRAVPVTADGEAIRILVCAPIELTELEDLADLLDRPLQPLITPEFRWNLVFATAYGLDPPARFTTLARTLEVDPTPTPVGRAPTVIVDAPELVRPDDAEVSAPIPVASDLTERTPQLEISVIDGGEPGRGRTSTLVGLVATGQERTAPLEYVPPAVHIAQPTRSPVSRRPPTQPIATEGRDAPLPIVRARELLATAADRDTVFLTLLRAARARARWAGLLTVQGGAAIGRVALAEPGLDTSQVHTVLIPLDVVSPFRTVVANQQPHIGPLSSGDPGIDAMVLRCGGEMPPSGLILPIVLRDRVVAIVVAHRVHSDIRLADVTELLPMATAASDALGRLIVKHKATGYRPTSEPGVVELEAEQIDTKRLVRSPQQWRIPERAATSPGFEQGTELSIDAEPPQPIDHLLDGIEAAGEGTSEEAIAEALARHSETLAALVRRFPGKLRVERFQVAGRPLRAAQYGGLLELVMRMGAVASELLIEKMQDAQRDIRFYAAVCCTELRPRNAVYALAERLFDQDYGVRACAIEALAGYPVHELGPALVRARRAVHSTDSEVVAAATAAIVELGDIDAIPDLIGVIERGDRGGDLARRALVALTAQDFGPNEKKWRRWHEAARQRHRIEWLIEGLAHKEDAIREAAINDLRRLTGEYFGYHYDLPRRERELATERWIAWWRDAGQRRFVPRASDERHRPTAQIRTPPRE
jgi:hypothetical protein